MPDVPVALGPDIGEWIIYIYRKTDSERVPWGKDWKRLREETVGLILKKIWKEPVNPV